MTTYTMLAWHFALLFVVSSFTLAASLPSGLSITVDAKPYVNGYKNGVMGFTGSINGIEVKDMKGSVEQIMAQMEHHHPGITASLAASVESDVASASSNFTTRDALRKEKILRCPIKGWDWKPCSILVLKDGIRYLENFHGVCNVGAHSCVRISCSYSAGIYLCNDTGNLIEPSCGFIADYVKDIIAYSGWDGRACGQEFDTDGFNVIAHRTSC